MSNAVFIARRALHEKLEGRQLLQCLEPKARDLGVICVDSSSASPIDLAEVKSESDSDIRGPFVEEAPGVPQPPARRFAAGALRTHRYNLRPRRPRPRIVGFFRVWRRRRRPSRAQLQRAAVAEASAP